MSGRPIKIVICDNDSFFSNELKRLIEKIYHEKGIVVSIMTVSTGKEVIEELNDNGIDAIFMDIELENESGFDIVSDIRKLDWFVNVVFISAHEKYWKRSFELKPFDFLVKPIGKADCEKVLDRLYEERSIDNRILNIEVGKTIYSVLYSNIIYVESDKHYLNYILSSGKIIRKRGKLDEVEKDMNKSDVKFLRIHKSYLVNLRHVICFSTQYVIMSNQVRLSIPQKEFSQVKKEYMKFVFGRD